MGEAPAEQSTGAELRLTAFAQARRRQPASAPTPCDAQAHGPPCSAQAQAQAQTRPRAQASRRSRGLAAGACRVLRACSGMAGWVFCNCCFQPPQRASCFSVTSCGHVYCHVCLSKGGERPRGREDPRGAQGLGWPRRRFRVSRAESVGGARGSGGHGRVRSPQTPSGCRARAWTGQYYRLAFQAPPWPGAPCWPEPGLQPAPSTQGGAEQSFRPVEGGCRSVGVESGSEPRTQASRRRRRVCPAGGEASAVEGRGAGR